jgi:hypothetical protein
VLVAELASPRYLAVIARVPTANLDVAKVATPPLILTDLIHFVPSLKPTLPVAVGPADVTVAVKVTACPDCEGFGLELSAVVVGYLSTTCLTLPKLGLFVPSPRYIALMALCPLSEEVENLATPWAVRPFPISDDIL